MKKVILSLVFVLATGVSFLNAETGLEKTNNEKLLRKDISYCDGYANAYAEMYNLTYEEANVYFEKCMNS